MSANTETPKPMSTYQMQLEKACKPKFQFSFSEPDEGHETTWTCRISILNKQVCTEIGKSQEEARETALKKACVYVLNGPFSL